MGSFLNKVKTGVKNVVTKVKDKITGGSSSSPTATSTPKITIPKITAPPGSMSVAPTKSQTTNTLIDAALGSTKYGTQPSTQIKNIGVRNALPSGSTTGPASSTVPAMTYAPWAPGGMSVNPAIVTKPKSGTPSQTSTKTSGSGGNYTPAPAKQGSSGQNSALAQMQQQYGGTDYTSRLAAARGVGGGGGGAWGPTPTATSGTTGGSPSFTGTLSSVSGLGATTVSPTEEEQQDQGTVQGSTIGSQYQPPTYQNTLPTMIEAGMNAPGLETPNIGTEFSATDIGAGVKMQPLTRETINTELERIKTEALRLKSILDAGLTPEPVEETVEQIQFIEETGDPYGIRQAMDNYRRQETNLMQLQSQRQEVFNGINAVTQAYEAVYKDIRENPDLPKGLAKRRLEDLYTRQKGVLDNYTSMMEQLNMQIEDQNGMVNRAFGIVENSQAQEERARQRKMEYLNFYINSGAIAGMSDKEIKEFAAATGVNPSGLIRIKNVKLDEENQRDLQITQLDNGDTVAIDKNTGKIVSNLGGRAATSDNVSNSSYAPGTAQGTLANQLEIVIGNAGSVSAQENARAHFNNLLKQGNTTEAQRFLDTLTVKGLTAADRTKFNGFGLISRVREDVRKLEAGFEKTNPGFYKTMLESAKPFANASTDPKWQEFVAKVQSTVNAYRNEIFGASLTGNELKAAGISLPVWDRDSFGTIVTKLDAMQSYAESVRGSLMQDAVGNFSTGSMSSVGGTTQEPQQTMLPGEDIFTATVQPKAEGGYWSNLESNTVSFVKSLFGQ